MSGTQVRTSVKFNAKTCNTRIETAGPSTSRGDSRSGTLTSQGCNTLMFENLYLEFTYCHVIILIISIITYCLDVAFACYIAYYYLIQGRITFFVLTVVFTFVPILMTTAFSMRWYLIDEDNYHLSAHRPSTKRWIIRIILVLLQMVQILRYVETLVSIIKFLKLKKSTDSPKKNRLYRRLLDEYSDCALLRLFHCFLHAAPQALLHSMLLIKYLWKQQNPSKTDGDELGNYLMLLISIGCVCWLISIAWSLTAYYRVLRVVRDESDKLSFCSMLVLFLWHFMSATSRVLALSILASVFPAWFGIVASAHWIVMTLWLALGNHQTAICTNRCEELILSCMLGFAYITAFIATRYGPTRYAYLVYYLVFFMENTGALVIWCVENNSTTNPYLYYGTAGAQILTFTLAILFMLLYYTMFHPTGTSLTLHKSVDLTTDDQAAITKPGRSKTHQ